MKQLFSPLLYKAAEFAAIKHEGQYRKHPVLKIPYIVHPMGVACILLRAGYDDEVVAAGILHDVLEDCGITANELAERFSPRISKLVVQVSEMDKSLSWAERKRLYCEELEKAEDEAVAIAAADHLHNLHSFVQALEDEPERAREMFKVDLGKKMENEERCLEIFKRRLNGLLADEIREVLSRLRKKLTL